MSETSDPRFGVDTAFRAVAARSRRYIFTALLEATDRTIRFEPLARRLTKLDQQDALGMVALELLHRDLPQLEAAGLVEYDMRSETITATDRIETIEPLLDAAQRVEHSTNSEA